MKIIIEAGDEGQVKSISIKDGKCTYDNLTAILFGVLDGATKTVLDANPEDEEMKAFLYEHFNGLFELFLRKVFPDPPKGYFDLSDAALIYAQDLVVNEAEKKGISFEDALDKFENRAKEYVRQKREGLA